MAVQKSGRGQIFDERYKVAGPSAPVAYVISAVLLGSAFVALLWVPSYAHLTPALGGIPFFYWYSLLWLVINACCQAVAYQLLVAGPRRRRMQATSGISGTGQ
ncbi:MAG: DUF3311 domain-containing protein [Candidatus Dormibacteraceae bacterium]